MTIQVRSSGVWKPLQASHVKHNGAWKVPSSCWVKVAGVWKQVSLGGFTPLGGAYIDFNDLTGSSFLFGGTSYVVAGYPMGSSSIHPSYGYFALNGNTTSFAPKKIRVGGPGGVVVRLGAPYFSTGDGKVTSDATNYDMHAEDAPLLYNLLRSGTLPQSTASGYLTVTAYLEIGN